MNVRLQHQGSCLLLFILMACVYSTNKEVVYPLKPATANGATIDLNSTVSPILILQPITFTFTVTPGNWQTYNYTVTISGANYVSGTSGSNVISFIVDPVSQSVGIATMTITVSVPSGSGSLADQLGDEFVVIQKSWQIDIEKAPTTPIPGPTVFIQDGKSYIQWIAPPNQHFLRLVLLRHYVDGPQSVATDSITVDPNSNPYWDATYIGGKVDYSLVIVAYPYKTSVAGPSTRFEAAPATPVFDSVSVPHTIKWDKPALYGNADVEFSIVDGLGALHELPAGDGAGGEFDLTPQNGVFLGSSHVYQVVLHATNYQHNITTDITGYTGTKIPAFQTVQYVPSRNGYALVYGNMIYKLSATDFSVTASVAFDDPGTFNDSPYLAISSDGLFGYIPKNSDSKIIQKIDLTSLTVVRSIDVSTYGYFSNIGYPLTLTDNNLLGFAATRGNIQSGVLDLTSNQLIYSVVGDAAFYLSPDGEYLASYNTVYQGKGSWSTVVGTYPTPYFPGPNPVIFLQQPGSNQLMRTYLAQTSLYDLNVPANGDGSLALTSVTTVSGPYDRYTNTIMGSQTTNNFNELQVYSVTDFSVIATYPAGYANSVISFSYRNGHFFQQNGYVD